MINVEPGRSIGSLPYQCKHHGHSYGLTEFKRGPMADPNGAMFRKMRGDNSVESWLHLGLPHSNPVQ